MRTPTEDTTSPGGLATPERAVLVTTAHRGVFFGYTSHTDGEIVRLKRARLCLYWSADMGGFMGLAARGPSATCKIGPPADIDVRHVTAVVSVTADAVQKWEAAKWPA